jgi:hypothetical protein
MNGDVSFASARTKEDAIVMLDWDNAEEAEISQIRNVMVDIRLNDEGDLQSAEFGKAARILILEQAYPRLLEAITTAPAQADPFASARKPSRPEHCRRRWRTVPTSTAGARAISRRPSPSCTASTKNSGRPVSLWPSRGLMSPDQAKLVRADQDGLPLPNPDKPEPKGI